MPSSFCIPALILAGLVGTDPLLAQPLDCSNRKLVVQVVDRKGALVRDLVQSDFAASYDGHPLTLASVQPHHGSGRVVLLLDKSGSMGYKLGNFNADLPPTPSEEMVLEEFLASLPPGVPLALIFFGETIESKTGFGETREKLHQLASHEFRDSKKWKGHTALWDAIFEAALLLDKAQMGDSIVLVSDGADNYSIRQPREVTNILLDQGIRLFAFIPLSTHPASAGIVTHIPKEVSGPGDLIQAADETGGSAAVHELADLGWKSNRLLVARDAGSIFWRFLTGYEVGIAVPKAWQKPQKWRLQIKDDIKTRKKIDRVEYPARLMPCPRLAEAGGR